MNYLHTRRGTNSAAFTLTELMVSAALVGFVSLMMMSVLLSTMKLSSRNVATNASHNRARQTLDRLGEVIRFAHSTPVLIKADGTAAGATSDGLLARNSLGGPYVFKPASGQADADIPETATSFLVEFAPAAGLSEPLVGDYFQLGLSKQPELEVATVGTVSTSGSIRRVLITTKQSLGEVARPGSYTVAGYRFRKEAFVFRQEGNSWQLRHYPRVTATTNYSSGSSYLVLGSGFQQLSSQPWFATIADNGTQAIWLRAVARSSNQAEFAQTSTGRNTLTSMPVQIKLWNYNAPPPPQT